MPPTNNLSNSSSNGKIVAALVIGLIIGFIAGAFWQERRLRGQEAASVSQEEREKSKNDSKDDSQVSSGAIKDLIDGTSIGSPSRTTATSTAEVSAQSQLAGSVVIAQRVVSNAPVWVAVREEQNGALGNILGARKIVEGENSNVVIPLLRPTIAGQRYFVVLYLDIGDPAFNYREDVLVPGIQASFIAE